MCEFVLLRSIKQRAAIIQQLLQDRDAAVAEAADKMLAHWLDRDCGSDPLHLLQLLDVETYTGEPQVDSPLTVHANMQA